MPVTRRRFLATAGSTLAVPAVHADQKTSKPILSFGLMADCQYADVNPAGARFFRDSLKKGEWPGNITPGFAAQYLHAQIGLAASQRALGVKPATVKLCLQYALSALHR